MVKCTKCGAENDAQAKICDQCGSKMMSSLDETTRALTPVPETEKELVEIGPEIPGIRVLVVKKGPNLGTSYPLEQERIVLGRDPKSDIFLNDITVSRIHAEIRITSSRVTVTDLGSLNGTYVNDARVDKASLKKGDIVQIGKFKLVYLSP